MSTNQANSAFHPFWVDKAAIGCLLPQLWWCHLVNAYEGKAGMVLFAGKTV